MFAEEETCILVSTDDAAGCRQANTVIIARLTGLGS